MIDKLGMMLRASVAALIVAVATAGYTLEGVWEVSGRVNLTEAAKMHAPLLQRTHNDTGARVIVTLACAEITHACVRAGAATVRVAGCTMVVCSRNLSTFAL